MPRLVEELATSVQSGRRRERGSSGFLTRVLEEVEIGMSEGSAPLPDSG